MRLAAPNFINAILAGTLLFFVLNRAMNEMTRNFYASIKHFQFKRCRQSQRRYLVAVLVQLVRSK